MLSRLIQSGPAGNGKERGMTDPVIGFISGTGPQGRGLGLRLAMAGLSVPLVIAVRERLPRVVSPSRG